MSVVHKSSGQCFIDQLELFRTQPTCNQVLQSIGVPHHTISSLDAGTSVLEFLIQGSGDQYVDLSRTKLFVEAHVEVDGKKIGDAHTHVAPTASFLSSMFQQCDVLLNDKLITTSNNLYPYRAYLEQILTYNQHVLSAQLGSQLFYRDTPGQHDEDSDDNEGYKDRKWHVARGRTFQVSGPLFNDLANQSAYLINNVDVRVKLTRAPDKFSLMAFDAEAATDATGTVTRAARIYTVRITRAELLVQKVVLNPANQIAIEAMLRRQNAVYSMRRTEMKAFTIAEGDVSYTLEHINLGLSPKYAIVGLVSTQAAQGDYRRSPFRFQHYNLKTISLNVDGEQVPRGGIQCDYANLLFLNAYDNLIDVVGKWRSDDAFSLERTDYVQGNVLYGFQIAPELVDGAFNMVRNTNIRMDIAFARALPENVTVLVWFAYDGVLEIDKDREIHYDFGA